MASIISAGTTSGTSLNLSGDTSGVLQLASNGSTTAVTINTSQGVAVLNCLGVGNATPSTSGAGITFPASQSASTDANTLDDYEEGTWTPTLVFSGGAGSASYTTRVGTYTKIGRVVYLSMDVVFVKGTASGTLDTISGIPFNTNGIFGGGAVIDGMSGLSGSPIWYFTGSIIYFYMTATGNLGSINATNMGATNNVLRFAGYYNI